MNYKIKSSISNSETLVINDNYVCFKSINSTNNHIWKLDLIDSTMGKYTISQNNNYLYFDGATNIVKVKNLDSDKEKFYWIIEGVDVELYKIKPSRQLDLAWYVYCSSGSCLDQPLLLLTDYDTLYENNKIFKLES